MESLLPVTFLLNQSFLTPEVTKLLGEFFSPCSSVTIISNNPSKWLNVYIQMGLPILIKSTNHKFRDDRPASGVLVDTTELQAEELLKRFYWNSYSKFIVISDSECSPSLLVNLFKKWVCNVIFVAYINNSAKICETTSKNCYLETPTLALRSLNMTRPVKEFTLRPQLKGCLLNISFMNFPPYAIIVNENLMDGIEGKFVHYMSQKLGFTAKYINRHEHKIGAFEPPTGLLGDLSTGSSIIGFGGLFPGLERGVKADMFAMCVPSELSFAVAAGIGPSRPISLIILVSELSPIVWLLLLLSYAFLVLIFLGYGKKRSKNSNENGRWPFHVLALLLGMSETVINYRILAIMCIIYGFVITSVYRSMMSSKLTLPPKASEITTLKELTNVGLEIQGLAPLGVLLKIIASESSDSYSVKLARRFKPTTDDAQSALQKIVRLKNIAYIKQRLTLISASLNDKIVTGRIHIVEEPITEYQPGTLITKGSCFTNDIQMVGLKLCEGGFGSKGMKDISGLHIKSKDHSPRKLGVADVKGSFYILVSGLAVSFLVQLGEWFYFFKKRKSLKQNENV